jgi:hypothetical protein
MGILAGLAARERRRKQRRLASRASSGAPKDIWLMLDLFEREVALGRPIDRRLQAAVNKILASAIRTRKLPGRQVGQPVRQGEIARQRDTALRLATYLAQGVSMNEAAAKVADEVSRSERVVFAHWKEYRGWAQKHLLRQETASGYALIGGEILASMGALNSRSLGRLEAILQRVSEDSDIADAPVFRIARRLQDDD